IAKQNNPSMDDIFLNRDLCNIQFREYFNPVIEFEYDIKYGGCQYELHDFVFCLDLKKIKVCQLDNDDLLMYQFKMKSGNDDVIKFGETFNSETGDCGMSLMINYLKLESVWKPDFNSDNLMSSLFDLMQKC
ncbi:2038_t:CDS:2, partial [Cetraspora pellucida]